MANSIQKVYIADGFVDDCEELIQRCLQSEMLSYGNFCNHWKDMKFAHVFLCRKSNAELAEFSEEAIHIAKRYMVSNTSNYEESVAGLFIVYALLQLQPFPGFAPLRVTPPDLDAIYCLKDVAKRQKRYDVLYILGKVLIEGPCEFHAADREYGMERSLRKYCQVSTSVTSVGARPKGVFYRQNDELDLLRELSSLGRRYTRAKALIYGNKRPAKTLDYMDEHLPNEMAASLKQLIVGSSGNAPKAEEDAVQSIKQRAMRDAVHGMRHLTGVAERQHHAKGSKSPVKTSDKKRKATQSSPSKAKLTAAENSAKGTKIDPPPPKRKRETKQKKQGKVKTTRKKNTKLFSDSSESDAIPTCESELSDANEAKPKPPSRTYKKPIKNITKDKVPTIATEKPVVTITKKTKKGSKIKKTDIPLGSGSDSDSDDFSLASSNDSNITDPEMDDLNSLPTIDSYIKLMGNHKQGPIDKEPVYIQSVDEQNLEIQIVNSEDKTLPPNLKEKKRLEN